MNPLRVSVVKNSLHEKRDAPCPNRVPGQHNEILIHKNPVEFDSAQVRMAIKHPEGGVIMDFEKQEGSPAMLS